MSTKPITFITYPRSGSTWLNWNIQKNTNLNAHFIHYDDIVNFPEIMSYPIITIVRNPVDCLSSFSVMMKHFDPFPISWVNDCNLGYVHHYEFILKNAKMLFSFDDVINNTNSVVNHLCNEFGGHFLNNELKYEEYAQWHEDTKVHENKLVTSKNEKKYDSVKEYLSMIKLPQHWELYNEALSKCVKLSV